MAGIIDCANDKMPVIGVLITGERAGELSEYINSRIAHNNGKISGSDIDQIIGDYLGLNRDLQLKGSQYKNQIEIHEERDGACRDKCAYIIFPERIEG